MEIEFGPIVTELPPGYVPRQQWPEYSLEAQIYPIFRPKVVGKEPRGVRLSLWLWHWEEYLTDVEPLIEHSSSSVFDNRTIRWCRPTHANVPPGWRESKKPSLYLEGFTTLDTDTNYTSNWSYAAKRYSKLWHTHYKDTYQIEVLSLQEFADAYKQSTVYKRAGRAIFGIIQRTLESKNAEHLTMWGVRRRVDQKIVAGLCEVHSPTYRSAYYQAGFIIPQEDKVPSMIALMDHWFAVSQKRGDKYLQFGQFWRAGLPFKMWEGLSRFKAKFGLSYVMYKPDLVHINSKR